MACRVPDTMTITNTHKPMMIDYYDHEDVKYIRILYFAIGFFSGITTATIFFLII